MLTVFSGLPADKHKDKNLIEKFSKSRGKKILCGTSTIRTYCRILNLTPEITINYTGFLPEAYYKIDGIALACEGLITLNDCYKNLSGKPVKNKNALILSDILKEEPEINFIIGTAKNPDSDFYKLKKLLPREEVINKIINLLDRGEKISVLKV